MKRCIVFTGGGSGGHIFPALAVHAELIKTWHYRTVWIGSWNGVERALCGAFKIPFYGIPSGKLRRYISLRNIADIVKIGLGFMVSLIVLLRERPLLIFSKGGYVSVPPVVAGYVLKIPAFTHESDFDPGLATRINTRFAEKIFVSFRDTEKYFPRNMRHKVLFTGNPVRQSILEGVAHIGKKFVGCPPDVDLLLVLGGSQGAKKINDAIDNILNELTCLCYVVHQMGIKQYKGQPKKNYLPVPFLKEELGHVLSAADIVVSRAGANNLCELSACGKPSVLVPLGLSASRGDQIRNAEVFRKGGAAVVISDKELTGSNLLELVRKLLDNKKHLKFMGDRARQLSTTSAARVIAQLLIKRASISLNIDGNKYLSD